MKAIIATNNADKIQGASKALNRFFESVEVVGIPMPSNVGEQPVNEETYLGAKNRVKNLKQYCKHTGIDADLFLAIETGICNFWGEWAITNVAIVEDAKNFNSFGTSPSFPVPKHLVNKIIETNLAHVINDIFCKDANGHNNGGSIQLLTNNQVSRVDLTEIAFIMALTKFLNKNWN